MFEGAEHALRPAGVEIARVPEKIGHEALFAGAPVRGAECHVTAEGAKFVLEQDLRRRGEAQHHAGLFRQGPGEIIERRKAEAARAEHGGIPGAREVEAVAEAGQHVERAGPHPAQRLGAFALDLIDQRQRAVLPVADREGPPEEEARDRHAHELPRRRDGPTVPREAEAENVGPERDVLRDLKLDLSHASMVEMQRVVSSSTSSSTRTVSSAVNMVMLFSVAQRRIFAPSLSSLASPSSRVLMT